MKKLTIPIPMLPCFYLPLRERKHRSTQQVFADKIAFSKQRSFKQVGELWCFALFLKIVLRQSYFKLWVVEVFSTRTYILGTFLRQILDADGRCKVPSSAAASYCTARKKPDEQTLSDIFQFTAM